MNQRIPLLILSICAATAVNAQSFSLRPVSGAILTGDTFMLTGNVFTVEVVLTLTQSVQFSAYNGALAYANVASGAGTSAIPTGPLTISSQSHSDWALTAFPTSLSAFVGRAASTISPLGYSTQAPQLPYVSFFARGTIAPTPIAAGDYTLATFTFNSAIASNDTFGDSTTEAGLQMVTQSGTGSPNLGSSGYSGTKVGSPKYKVQAVPEPATMLVLGTGLAVIAQRRKKA